MRIRELFSEDEAVSPVIGVILMVAITVILAAVIGTFVLGLGDQVQSTSPQASFSFDFTDSGSAPGDSLEITHDGGDSIPANQLNASVTGGSANDAADSTSGNPDTGSDESIAYGGDLFGSSGDVAAGTSSTISGGDFSVENDPFQTGSDVLKLNDATVRVVWTSETGENSATLGEWSGPDA